MNWSKEKTIKVIEESWRRNVKVTVMWHVRDHFSGWGLLTEQQKRLINAVAKPYQKVRIRARS